jgi:aspartyl-tRNA synthetase
MKFTKRTHTCGELTAADNGKTVVLNGWVSQIRDLGGVLFVNLRDRYGITQLLFKPENEKAFESAGKLMHEYVISAKGMVQKRTSANPKLKTGEIEVNVAELEVLTKSEVPPFVIEEQITAMEDLRLKYRYLELRGEALKNNIILRNEAAQAVHNYFHKLGFVEVETPVLTKSTPEGARDYLVPSRIHKGKFYALPQSPQIYKQILMIAGFDRYVQLTKCFRDEDLRADRQPEHTQIDLEMSFVTHDDVFEVVEGCMKEIWKKAIGKEIEIPFRRMTYDEAMEKYGTDKPDLRYGMEIVNITDEVKNSDFRVFKDAIDGGGIAAGIKFEGEVTRKKIDELTEFVKKYGFGGLAYIKFAEGEINSPIKKFLTEEQLNKIKKKFSASSQGIAASGSAGLANQTLPGNTIFILSGEKKSAYLALGKLRIKLAEDYLKDSLKDKFEFLWVTDFPLFTWNEEEKRLEPEHHPFTSPRDEDLHLLDSENQKEIAVIKADCYDLVLNGTELGSGSIRIHNTETQSKVFKIIGLSDTEAKEKFGFLLEAFKYGAPPHGGAGLGFDRIVAMLAGQSSIRDFIAFPKTVSAVSLMDGSPGEVSLQQLKELGIKISGQ